ncbi:universal stress protein [Pseudonocardia adelaidensis]|uniref:universal stress protein n=1 Tax=Pseudonocardia adelaidensis TaxID=648754 RepID=UPI003CD067F2
MGRWRWGWTAPSRCCAPSGGARPRPPGAACRRGSTPWADEHPDVQVERVVVRGHSAVEPTTRSGAAQLGVVGARGGDQVAGLLLGSVGNASVHRAECPLAVARMVEGGDRDAS